MFEVFINSGLIVFVYQTIRLIVKLIVTYMICKNKLSDKKVEYITNMFSKAKS